MSIFIAAIRPGPTKARQLFFGTLTIWLAISLPPVYALLTLTEFASHFWPLAAILLYSFAVLVCVTISAIALNYALAHRLIPRLPHWTKMPPALRCGLATAGMVGLVVSFGELCRNLALRFGGFTATQIGFWHWLWFGVSVVVDNVSFGALQAYGWQASEIQTIEPWSRALAWAYTFTLTLMGLGIIVRWIVAAGERMIKGESVAQKTLFTFLLSRAPWLALAFVWIIPTLVFGGAAVSGALTQRTAVSGVQTGVPIVLAAWLGWHCLLALRVPGLRNKVVAVACLGLVSLGVVAFLIDPGMYQAVWH